MTKSYLLWLALPVAALLAGCTADKEKELQGEFTTIEISVPDAKTSLGPSEGGIRKVFWANGDQIAINGTSSIALSGLTDNTQSTNFTFEGVLDTPYNVLYPASCYKNASTITLPAEQNFVEGTFANNTYPMAGYATEANSAISLNHLCGIIMIQLKKDPGVSASNLTKVTFKSKGTEQVCGDFTIDYQNHTITGTSTAEENRTVSLTLSEALDETNALNIFLVVPAIEYASGFSVEMEDAMHRTMTKETSSAKTLAAGHIMKMAAFTFVPSAIATEFVLESIIEDIIEPDSYNVKGRVVDNSGHGIEGVVVSDGTQCVRTLLTGEFFMTSNISNVKYVQISTPSGYIPTVEGGIPRFYKEKASISPVGGIYDFGDFVVTPVANPNTFTIFVTADPQPRSSELGLDNVAYRSGRACESLYLDLKETKAAITDRQVIGICLGDLTHEDMDLMGTYATALGTLGYPTYNIIGNHDNDPTGADDDKGAEPYESYFGPRNYSFNMGGIHFVMLDDLIMKNNGSGELKSFDQGLTDAIWTWLQADMSFVPTTTTVMVCAHSPMFKQESGSERSNTAKHGGSTNVSEGGAYGYGDLFDQYDEVHAWAGHTHSTFNHIYSNSHRHHNVQVHTLARSTGELWTNEYLSNGTPRGFTIVEVKDGKIDSWRFHPTKYLKSNFHGTHGQPTYNYCDWTFEGSSPKVAKMKDTGLDLDESYQMHVYKPSAYGDNKIYANIFLWDRLWDAPTISINGGTPVNMIQVETVNTEEANRTGYDKANDEIISFYYANYSLLRAAGYTDSPRGVPLTMFKSPEGAPASGTAIVSVTDRFGNTYSRVVSW